MSDDLSQFHDAFFEESFDNLDAMEQGLLELVIDEMDKELINTIFRAAHSIKGGSGMFGFDEIMNFTHILETLLDKVRHEEHELTQEVVDLFLESVDVMRTMMENRKQGLEEMSPEAQKLQDTFSTMLAGGEEASTENPVEEVAAVEEQEVSQEPATAATEDDEDAILQALFDEVKAQNETPAAVESAEKVDAAVEKTTTEAAAAEPAKEEEKPKPEVNPKPAAKPAAKPAGKDNNSIRVSTDKIDAIINLVGELVITQSMLTQFTSDDQSSKKLQRLREGLNQLEHNTRELQESVMMIRMLPINMIFNRFPRVVRDLAKQLNKKIKLEMLGTQTELDKTVLEQISDPMVHLIRNAADHGIETPDVRLANGKSEEGTITLNAFHQGGCIVIQIQEDGAGLNVEKIRSIAVNKGLISENVVLTDEEVHELIFRPGFSTADTVSDVSGRGVGMDVVRKNIASLNGSIEVSSKEGHGSTFTIRLPLTLAILEGQLFLLGTQTYVIPIISIVESIEIQKERIKYLSGNSGEVYFLRDEYIPLIRLNQFLPNQVRAKSLEESLLIVVEVEERRLGLVVDDLLAQQQVVIKSLEDNYRKIDGISGATILGDGKVALILDAIGIKQMIDYHKNNSNFIRKIDQHKNTDIMQQGY